MSQIRSIGMDCHLLNAGSSTQTLVKCTDAPD